MEIHQTKTQVSWTQLGHLWAVQPQKSHLTLLCLTFPTSRMWSLDHMFAEVPCSLKLGWVLAAKWHLGHHAYDSHTRPGSAAEPANSLPDLQRSTTRLWITGPMLKTPILGQISSFAKWGWSVTQAKALGPGGTLCPPVLSPPCQIPPTDLSSCLYNTTYQR